MTKNSLHNLRALGEYGDFKKDIIREIRKLKSRDKQRLKWNEVLHGRNAAIEEVIKVIKQF